MLFFTRPIDSSRKKFIENNVRPKKGKETKSESAIRVASETKLQQNTYEQISALIYFKSCIVTGKLHVLPSYLPVLFAYCSYKQTYILSSCKPCDADWHVTEEVFRILLFHTFDSLQSDERTRKENIVVECTLTLIRCVLYVYV